MVGHHHSIKEMQYLEVLPKEERKWDTIRITVHNVSLGGSYKLSFQNPSNNQYWTTNSISVTASRSTF